MSVNNFFDFVVEKVYTHRNIKEKKMNINVKQLSSYQRFMDFELYEKFRKENVFNIRSEFIKQEKESKTVFGLPSEDLESYILLTKGKDLKQFAQKYPEECIIEKKSLDYIEWQRVDAEFLHCMESFVNTEEDEHMFLIKVVEISQNNPVIETYFKEFIRRKKIDMVDFLLRNTENRARARLIMMDELGYYSNSPMESMIDKIFHYAEDGEKYKILSDYLNKVKNTAEIPVLNKDVSMFIAQSFSKEECKNLFKEKKLSLQNISEIVSMTKWEKSFFYSLQYGQEPLYIHFNIGILIVNDLLDINIIRKDIHNKRVRNYLTSIGMYSALCSENIKYAMIAEDIQNDEGDSLLHYCGRLNAGNNNIYNLYTLFYNNKSYLNLKNKERKTFIDELFDNYNYAEIIEILYKDKNIVTNNQEIFENIINYVDSDKRVCSSGENKIIISMIIDTQKNILTEAAKMNNLLLSSVITRL